MSVLGEQIKKNTERIVGITQIDQFISFHVEAA